MREYQYFLLRPDFVTMYMRTCTLAHTKTVQKNFTQKEEANRPTPFPWVACNRDQNNFLLWPYVCFLGGGRGFMEKWTVFVSKKYRYLQTAPKYMYMNMHMYFARTLALQVQCTGHSRDLWLQSCISLVETWPETVARLAVYQMAQTFAFHILPPLTQGVSSGPVAYVLASAGDWMLVTGRGRQSRNLLQNLLD